MQYPRASPSPVSVNPMSAGSGEGAVLGTRGRASLWRGSPSWSCNLQIKDVARPWVCSKEGGRRLNNLPLYFSSNLLPALTFGQVLLEARGHWILLMWFKQAACLGQEQGRMEDIRHMGSQTCDVIAPLRDTRSLSPGGCHFANH